MNRINNRNDSQPDARKRGRAKSVVPSPAPRVLARQTGFTLVETLLVVSLMCMIGLSLYQAVNNGIKIWQRSQQSTVDEDVILFLERINFDVRNVFYFSLLKFKGEENRLSLPTIVHTRADNSITQGRVDYLKQMGRVEYYFDKDKRSIFRRQANYGQALKNKFGPPEKLVISVKNVRFIYYYPKKTGAGVLDTSKETIPAALKIELAIIEPAGQIRQVQRFFNMPVGTKL